MTTINAIKPVWNGRTFNAKAISDTSTLAAHEGYFVYEAGKEAEAAAAIRAGQFVQSWTEKKKACVLAFLDTVAEARADAAEEAARQADAAALAEVVAAVAASEARERDAEEAYQRELDAEARAFVNDPAVSAGLDAVLTLPVSFVEVFNEGGSFAPPVATATTTTIPAALLDAECAGETREVRSRTANLYPVPSRVVKLATENLSAADAAAVLENWDAYTSLNVPNANKQRILREINYVLGCVNSPVGDTVESNDW